MLRELADGIKNMVIMNLQVVVRWEGQHVCWRKSSELKWIMTTFKITIKKMDTTLQREERRKEQCLTNQLKKRMSNISSLKKNVAIGQKRSALNLKLGINNSIMKKAVIMQEYSWQGMGMDSCFIWQRRSDLEFSAQVQIQPGGK